MMANLFPHSRKSLTHDGAEDSDHIGSGADTPPPGTSTPRPDLSDKRLPQISNFFAQVGSSSHSSTIPHYSGAASGHADDAATSSPRPSSSRVTAFPTPATYHNSTSNPPGSRQTQFDAMLFKGTQEQGAYPTPPASSASSAHITLEPTSNGTQPAVAANKTLAQNAQPIASQITSPPLLPSTAPTAPATAAISSSSATAEISNSTNHGPARLISSLTHARRPSSQSDRASVKRKCELTDRAFVQTTPPQTPRALSSESRTEHNGVGPSNLRQALTRTHSSASHQASVGHIKGQLAVSILKGRGLKPSTAPYVVCIFQLNEDISEGAQPDVMDTRQDHHSQDEDLARGVAMRRIGSDQGRPLSIPTLGSRQSSQTDIAKLRTTATKNERVTDPVWNHEAVFDVTRDQAELDICIYDKNNNEAFLGNVRVTPNLDAHEAAQDTWYKLQPRASESEQVTGEICLRLRFRHTDKKTYGPEDFEILKLIGKGTFGQVFQVRKKDNNRIYAMKVLSKKVIVQKKEVQHTIGERNILVRTATTDSPFIVGLKFSFQTPADLYLVTDYMSGGELFWHLQREGRFLEDRAKFYIAELILALRHLHQHDIVYRDLKPENILLDANGHIALCDFGLSKANLSKGDTTNTFCGTTEYLAPEVLLDEQGYTKMVDFWSLGVLVFEMCCGWSPFYAEDTQQMYKNIAFGKVRFPRDALSVEGRNFVKGLLNRNPSHRLGAKGDADELMAHPFFDDIDWVALGKKQRVPPFKPKLKGELDTSNFDPEFTNALASGNASSLNARAAAVAAGINPETPLSPTLQSAFKGFTFVDDSMLDKQFGHGLSRTSTREEDGEELRRTISRSNRMSGVETSDDAENMFADQMQDD